MNKIDKEFALQCRLITSGMQGLFLESLQEFAALVRAEEQKKWEEQTDIDIREAVADERNAIYDQWHSCVMADLENGVKFLNEKAATEWQKNYPAQSKTFPEWIEARGQA